MLPQDCAAEAHQDQVMILIVAGVMAGNILEQTEVFPKDVLNP